jgi:hypothetical protein
MKKLKMFDNYKKLFWGTIAFLMILLCGMLSVILGIMIGVGFILGIIFGYALNEWDEPEQEEGEEE